MAALERILPDLRAILAAKVPFQFMHGRRFGAPDDRQRNRVVRVAAETADLEIGKAGV